jgi:hypothetical protein
VCLCCYPFVFLALDRRQPSCHDRFVLWLMLFLLLLNEIHILMRSLKKTYKFVASYVVASSRLVVPNAKLHILYHAFYVLYHACKSIP